MTAKQFKEAFEIAKSDKDLSNVDYSILDGCALLDFKPVFVSLEQVARMIRYHCAYLDGGWDWAQLKEIARYGRRKFKIIEG